MDECQNITAGQLLDPESSDGDGNGQDRLGAVSVISGPDPAIRECNDHNREIDLVARWIQQRLAEGLTSKEFGVFVRSSREIPRAQAALELANLPDEQLQATAMRLGSKSTLSTMHLAKRLEFRAVVVMACDDDVIPNAERIKALTDDCDLDAVVATEHHLL